MKLFETSILEAYESVTLPNGYQTVRINESKMKKIRRNQKIRDFFIYHQPTSTIYWWIWKRMEKRREEYLPF